MERVRAGAGLAEKQVITTWYDPKRVLPEQGITVVVTITGYCRNTRYDHAIAKAEYWDDGGWFFEEMDPDTDDMEITVNAWCDLEPYKE